MDGIDVYYDMTDTICAMDLDEGSTRKFIVGGSRLCGYDFGFGASRDWFVLSFPSEGMVAVCDIESGSLTYIDSSAYGHICPDAGGRGSGAGESR